METSFIGLQKLLYSRPQSRGRPYLLMEQVVTIPRLLDGCFRLGSRRRSPVALAELKDTTNALAKLMNIRQFMRCSNATLAKSVLPPPRLV
jgi:hypothetical protein